MNIESDKCLSIGSITKRNVCFYWVCSTIFGMLLRVGIKYYFEDFVHIIASPYCFKRIHTMFGYIDLWISWPNPAHLTVIVSHWNQKLMLYQLVQHHTSSAWDVNHFQLHWYITSCNPWYWVPRYYIAVPCLSVDRMLSLDDQHKEPMVNTKII